MQRLEVSGAVRPIYGALGVKRLTEELCFSLQNERHSKNQPHQISKTQRTKNKTTDVVIQQHSRKLLMMDILISETCWARKKWNEIASDIKLVFHSSAVNSNLIRVGTQLVLYIKLKSTFISSPVFPAIT